MEMRIAFIGGGNMGEAMLSAVLKHELSTPEAICVSDVSEERRRYLKNEYGVEVTDNNRRAVEGKDITVLAVKPQNMAEIMAELNGCVSPDKLIMSIAAGVRLDTLSQGFGHSRVVRVMPNTPAQVGSGMSVWTATAGVTEEQKRQARAVLDRQRRRLRPPGPQDWRGDPPAQGHEGKMG